MFWGGLGCFHGPTCPSLSHRKLVSTNKLDEVSSGLARMPVPTSISFSKKLAVV